MPNAPLRANARTMPRRAILGAVLAAGAVGAIPAAAAIALTSPVLTPADQRALHLWKRLRRILAIRQRFGDQMDAAEARTPAWAMPGPQYVYPDGRPAEKTAFVGWPMVADLSQEHVDPVSGLILARPQVEEIYDRWRQMARVDRGTATLALNRALAAHAERLRQRDIEQDRSGYARAEARFEASGEALSTLENEIEDLEGSVLALAAQLMVEIRIERDEEAALRLYRASLAAIRPQLVGPIAEDADVVLAEDARRDVA